jgi:hypothetical protein
VRKHESVWWIGGFLFGLAVGMGLSLAYAWGFNAPPLDETTPAALNPNDKEIYTVLVAAAYASDGDLDRAKKRLAKLEDLDIESTIVSLAERYVREDHDVRDVRVLARLADGLGKTSAAVRPFVATPTDTPSPTPTLTPVPPTSTATRPKPTRTATPKPTRTPTTTRTPARPTATRTPTLTRTATPQPDLFRVVQSTALCGDVDGMLRVYVRDGDGDPVGGVQVLVDWPGGSDQFFTGFKSSADVGYADFEMDAGEIYQVSLVDRKSETAVEVGADPGGLCPDLAPDSLPSWQVVFQLP